MTAIPNPWISDSAVPTPTAADTAVASNQHPHAQDATAGPFDESSMARGGQGAPADDPNPTAAGATDHIHEIFHHARKLIVGDHRFVLDERAFMEAIEERPLFLRRAYLR